MLDNVNLNLTIQDYERQFSDALALEGLGEHHIPANTGWHDIALPEHKTRKKSGAAKLTFPGDGVVIDRKKPSGETKIFEWTPDDAVVLTAEQREELDRKNAEEAAKRKIKQEQARLTAANGFPLMPDADANNPYLKKKGITNPHPLKLIDYYGNGEQWLVVPMYNAMDNEFQTLQLIGPKGEKRFLKDGVTSGACVIPGSSGLGDLNFTSHVSDYHYYPVIIAEGYATAEAIQRSTNIITLAAMGCSNLKAVAEAIRQRFPKREIIIAADNEKSGVGLICANAAAKAVNGKVASPSRAYGDFSDLLLAKGVDVVKAFIENAAAPPPEDEDEVKQDAAASDNDNADPVDLWGTFDPPPLPIGLLPKTIERYALIEGENMGCDPAGLAMSALTCCAAAISDDIKLKVKEHDDWTEPARVWVGLVADPSGKKTPIINKAAWPIGRIDSKLTAEYLAAKEIYDELSAADRKNQPAPQHQQIKLEDTTIEAAQEVLKVSPDGVLCLQDELSGFFGMMDKYSGKGGAAADRAFWMKAYNGGEQKFHRIARGSGIMPNLSICLLGGIQPDIIRKLASDGADDGLLQRALFVVLRPSMVDQDKPHDPVVNDYFKLVNKLHDLIPPQQPGFNENAFEFTVLRFDPGAQAIRNQLAKKHNDLMKSESINKKLATHIGKYDGVFARLCVLWHCIENVDETNLPTIVTEDTARRVARFLHEFILKHAIAFYAGVLGLSNDHDRLKNVAGFILARKLDKITNRDIAHGDRSMRNLTDWDTLKLFEQLEALGWVERKLPTKPPQKLQWMVNPKVHVQFAERAKREKQRRDEARDAVADILKK